NIAESILKPQKLNYKNDIRGIGTLLISVKKPGTIRRNPTSLEFENQKDISEHCRSFIKQTASSSVKELIN
ncbi:hypothetical protein AbraIFM66950_002647, partial [Aspergillus brasiliensis]